MGHILQITKDQVVPISIGLLITLIGGIIGLTLAINNFTVRIENRLASLEIQSLLQWNYYMDRESWLEFQRLNPDNVAPDIDKIRKTFGRTQP